MVLTTCGSDPDASSSALETLQQQQQPATHQSLRVPYGVPSPPTGLSQTPESSSQQSRLGPVGSGIHGQSGSGEYTLFGNSSNPARN